MKRRELMMLGGAAILSPLLPSLPLKSMPLIPNWPCYTMTLTRDGDGITKLNKFRWETTVEYIEEIFTGERHLSRWKDCRDFLQKASEKCQIIELSPDLCSILVSLGSLKTNDDFKNKAANYVGTFNNKEVYVVSPEIDNSMVRE